MVSSWFAGVAILVRRDSQLRLGDFTHHPDGRAIVLELTNRGTPIQVVNAYLSAKGTAKEYSLCYNGYMHMLHRIHV